MNVLHSENPLQAESDWMQNYRLVEGDTDVTKVNENLVAKIPGSTQMGKVYARLIRDTATKEDYVDGIVRIYNNEICETIDNYNRSAYYEPSYVVARAYQTGGF